MTSYKHINIDPTSSGYGFTISDEDYPYERFARISHITKGGSAEKIGLNVGDFILAVNDIAVHHMTYVELSRLIRKSGNRSLRLTVLNTTLSAPHYSTSPTFSSSHIAGVDYRDVDCCSVFVENGLSNTDIMLPSLSTAEASKTNMRTYELSKSSPPKPTPLPRTCRFYSNSSNATSKEAIGVQAWRDLTNDGLLTTGVDHTSQLDSNANHLGRNQTLADVPPDCHDHHLPIRFVRKRAYASARNAKQHELSTPSPSSKPCQLLPAVRNKQSPLQSTSVCSPVEPRVIHLPRRKSSQLDDGALSSKISTSSTVNATTSHSSIKAPGTPYATSTLNSSSAISGPLSSRLWASFDQDSDPDTGRPIRRSGDQADLWTRAGELYHLLEHETKRLALKQAVRSDSKTRSSNQLDAKVVESRASPVHVPKVVKSNIPTNSPTPAALPSRRLHFGNLRSGLRSHRSESNIMCDVSGSFVSRQCLCKVIFINGMDHKKYSWRPYYMSVSGSKVRFIKTSWAFCGTNAKFSSTKNIKTVIGSTKQSNCVVGTKKLSTTPTESSDTTTTAMPTICATDSCLVLPIPGLVWLSESLPADFPTWNPLGASSTRFTQSMALGSTCAAANCSPKTRPASLASASPDWMDPQRTGLFISTPSASCRTVERDKCVDVRAKLQCVRFGHVTVGVELLFVFPDESAALSSLKLCQLSGGQELTLQLIAKMLDEHPCRFDHSSTPYKPFLLKPSIWPVLYKNICPSDDSLGHKPIVLSSKHVANMFIPIGASMPAAAPVHIQCPVPKDRRQRHVNQSSKSSWASAGEEDDDDVGACQLMVNKSFSTISSGEPNQRHHQQRQQQGSSRLYQRHSKKFWSRHRHRNYSEDPPSDQLDNHHHSHAESLNSLDFQTSPNFPSKFIRNVKQWFHRPSNTATFTTSTAVVGNLLQPATTTSGGGAVGTRSHSVLGNESWSNTNKDDGASMFSRLRTNYNEVSPIKLEKINAILADPPNLSESDTPGPIFGASLEHQLESSDYPCVPVLLQALILALETHGLNLPGLYRKPGRHRTVSQFVCASNLAGENLELLCDLDAWHEPNVLCGLIKHYLRRLKPGLFTTSAWEPLISLIPADNSNLYQTAYLLLAIRVQLKKMALEALGYPVTNDLVIGHRPLSLATTSPVKRRSLCSTTKRHLAQHRLTRFSYPSSSRTPLSIPSGHSTNSSSFDAKPMTACCDQLDCKQHHTFVMWRWATLCFVVDHIQRVVGHRKFNDVNYQCIAICFGPVFFGSTMLTNQLSKFNKLLEYLFAHWLWLVDGIPQITHSFLQDPANLHCHLSINEPTLQQTVDYLSSRNIQSSPRLSKMSNNGGSAATADLANEFVTVSMLGGQEQEQENLDIKHQIRLLILRASDADRRHEQPMIDESDGKYVVQNTNKHQKLTKKSSKFIKQSSLHRVTSALPKSSPPHNFSKNASNRRRLTVATPIRCVTAADGDLHQHTNGVSNNKDVFVLRRPTILFNL